MKNYNKLKTSLIVLSLLSTLNCEAQKKQENIATEIIATWIAEDDPNVKIVFNNQTYLSYYKNELVGTYKYYISNHCGKESDDKAWFMKTIDQEDLDERCYELYGANVENNNTLSMRDLTNGKIFIYNKQ